MRREAVYLEDMVRAAGRLSAEFQARHAEIPWREVTALRNRIVHGYFSLDNTLVWQIATFHTPALREQIAAILRAEFPESGATQG